MALDKDIGHSAFKKFEEASGYSVNTATDDTATLDDVILDIFEQQSQ